MTSAAEVSNQAVSPLLIADAAVEHAKKSERIDLAQQDQGLVALGQEAMVELKAEFEQRLVFRLRFKHPKEDILRFGELSDSFIALHEAGARRDGQRRPRQHRRALLNLPKQVRLATCVLHC